MVYFAWGPNTAWHTAQYIHCDIVLLARVTVDPPPPTRPPLRSMVPDLSELRQKAGQLEANLEARFDAAEGGSD